MGAVARRDRDLEVGLALAPGVRPAIVRSRGRPSPTKSKSTRSGRRARRHRRAGGARRVSTYPSGASKATSANPAAANRPGWRGWRRAGAGAGSRSTSATGSAEPRQRLDGGGDVAAADVAEDAAHQHQVGGHVVRVAAAERGVALHDPDLVGHAGRGRTVPGEGHQGRVELDQQRRDLAGPVDGSTPRRSRRDPARRTGSRSGWAPGGTPAPRRGRRAPWTGRAAAAGRAATRDPRRAGASAPSASPPHPADGAPLAGHRSLLHGPRGP